MKRRDLFKLGAAAIAGRPLAAAETTAGVLWHNGVPALFVNGRAHAGMCYAAYTPSVEVFRDFAKAGVDLYTFVATPTEGGHTRERSAWLGPGKYDFSQLDERVAMVLEANPKAYFFPRLYMHTPRWWSELHPDDMVLADRDGKLAPYLEPRSGNKAPASWTSALWRTDTIEGLRRLIAHVDASSYADRCVGYHLASGTTDEWMAWGANDREWVDYSPVNTAAFRRWIGAKYRTVDALRKAWNDPSAAFETAGIPSKAARAATKLGTLRDPATEQAVLDFYNFNSDVVVETICELAGAVKRYTGGKKFVGVFYGYLLQLCAEIRQQNAGHLALERVLACPHVDFLCSPASKTHLELGGKGTSYFMSLTGSVRLHGKLWFEENDIRTSLTKGFSVGSLGKPENVAGDILQQNKEMGHIITAGAAQWWFDVGRIRYNDPALMRRLGELGALAGEALKLDRTPADQVAMIVDERSLCYMRPGDAMGGWLLNRQLPALSRIGAPVGHYLPADLPKIEDRRLLLFMTSFAPTAAHRAAVEALKSKGRVLMFFYAPGLYRDGRLDEAAMTAFTGIKLRMSRTAAVLRATVKPGHPITEGITGQMVGIRDTVSPACYADDPDAAVLATLADGRPAIVVKPQKGWTAVFSSVPMLPASLLRRISQVAGVHHYIETEDVVWAARDLVAISVYQAGRRKIRLPGAAAVRDFYSGEEIAKSADAFDADFEEYATRVFVQQRVAQTLSLPGRDSSRPLR